MGEIKGYISQVIGPVVDIHFDYGTEETVTLPRIHDAMEISRPNGKILIVEVQQHIGENTVRTVAMDTTDDQDLSVWAGNLHGVVWLYQ